MNGVSKYGYALVSSDYRLAPQTGVREILQDVKDCIAFIRNELAAKLGGDALDPTRLVVSGSSAGGYLTLLTGLYVEPKPSALLCIYPITDPLGQFFSSPQPDEIVDPALVAEFLNVDGEVVGNNAPGPRDKMYNHMLENANYAQLLQVSGDEFRISKNIDRCGLPPTYIVHGDADIDVGVDQVDEVVGVMVGLGLEVVYKRPRGVAHSFDLTEDITMDDMYEFMQKYL